MPDDPRRRPAEFVRSGRRAGRGPRPGRRVRFRDCRRSNKEIQARILQRWPHELRGMDDIWQTAMRMIHRHGAFAPRACARRADDCLDAGNRTSWVLWFRVLAAIERLQAATPAQGEAVH
jgi:hypothetical protein